MHQSHRYFSIFKALKKFKKILLLIILVAIFSLAIYYKIYHYFSFESLKEHREILLSWRDKYFLWIIIGFISIYILVVACSIPGAIFLSLTAGFLFGPLLGTIITIFSATIGSFIIFLAVELAFREWFAKKAGKAIKNMEMGFNKNAFSYLLTLRLVPIFPFWLVNIVSALLGISKRIFILATFIGIIPGSVIYVLVGNGLGHVFDANQTPNLHIIYDPQVLLPLLALAILSLLPVIVKFFKFKREK